MTLSERAAVLAVGTALWVPGLIGLWKAASLRGEIFNRWNTRVGLAFNGLSQRAADDLLRIQGIITELVGSAGSPFDPLKVVEDPSALREPMERFQDLLKVRDKLRPQFSALLSVGPVLLAVIPVYLTGVAVATTYVAELHHLRGPTIICDYAIGLAILALIVTFTVYAYLQQHLASAEITAQGA